jgi:hypothetical protein
MFCDFCLKDLNPLREREFSAVVERQYNDDGSWVSQRFFHVWCYIDVLCTTRRPHDSEIHRIAFDAIIRRVGNSIVVVPE